MFGQKLEQPRQDRRAHEKRRCEEPFELLANDPLGAGGGINVISLGAVHFHPIASPALPSAVRSEEHTSELQSLMRISYAVFCLKKKNNNTKKKYTKQINHNYTLQF